PAGLATWLATGIAPVVVMKRRRRRPRIGRRRFSLGSSGRKFRHDQEDREEDGAMKRDIHVLRIALLAILGMGLGGCASTSDEYSASASASYGDYSRYGDDDTYDELDRYGTWVENSTYGEVWCPLDVSAGWRPYTVGRWAYTDYGWMWVAEDPWGYVPYHYGRWTCDSYYGWVWIPGDVCAPAWVSWRYGDGWIGWAPLPPDAEWNVGI